MRRRGLCGCGRVRMRSHGGKWALIQCGKCEYSIAQSCPTPGDPMDPCPSGSFVHGIFFPGKNTGVGCPFSLPRDLLDPGVKATSPASSALQTDSLSLSHRGKPNMMDGCL